MTNAATTTLAMSDLVSTFAPRISRERWMGKRREANMLEISAEAANCMVQLSELTYLACAMDWQMGENGWYRDYGTDRRHVCDIFATHERNIYHLNKGGKVGGIEDYEAVLVQAYADIVAFFSAFYHDKYRREFLVEADYDYADGYETDYGVWVDI